MMSLNEKLDWFDSKRAKIESFFDEHPNPENILMDTFELKFEHGKKANIEVFYDLELNDNFMVKITFHSSQKALHISKLINQTILGLGWEQILWNKKLFLLRKSFFEC